MIAELHIWEAQDALVNGLADVPALSDVARDIGFPRLVEREHVWVTGEATGSLDTELSGGAPASESFRLTVVVFVSLADEYLAVRDRARELAAYVEGVLDSDRFRAVVPAWTMPEYRLEEGTDGTRRQVAISLGVQCQCW